MAKYIWISNDIVHKTNKTLQVDGIDLEVQISQYDAPRSISGAFDKANGLFRIVFQYSDKEPAKAGSTIDGIQFIEGRHSGKLLEIVIPTEAKKLKVVSLQTQVLDALEKRGKAFKGLPTINRELNQDVAKDVFQSTSFKDLTEELVGV